MFRDNNIVNGIQDGRQNTSWKNQLFNLFSKIGVNYVYKRDLGMQTPIVVLFFCILCPMIIISKMAARRHLEKLPLLIIINNIIWNMVFYVFGMQKLILLLILQLYLHPNTKAFDVPIKGVGIFFMTKFYFAESQSFAGYSSKYMEI